MSAAPLGFTRRIGGSDVAKLLGISKFGNAADVYLRVVEGVEDVWNSRMERGAAVEPQLRAYAQNFLGLTLQHTDSDYFDHPTHEFARAQVDDVGLWNGLPVAVDYKSQNRFVKGWGASMSDDVPEIYRVQMAWELACTDRDLGLLVVGFGDDAPPPEIFSLTHCVAYQVQREPTLEALCVQTAREFWERHVLPRTPPPMKPLGKKAKKS